jgi:predicted thioesterase
MNSRELPEGVLCVRQGPGANCSSIGSAVHLLFATGALAAMVAVVASALAQRQEDKPADAPGREPSERVPNGDDGG